MHMHEIMGFSVGKEIHDLRLRWSPPKFNVPEIVGLICVLESNWSGLSSTYAVTQVNDIKNHKEVFPALWGDLSFT